VSMFVFVFVFVCLFACLFVCLFGCVCVCLRVRGYMSAPNQVPSICDLCVPQMDMFVSPPSEQTNNFSLMGRLNYLF